MNEPTLSGKVSISSHKLVVIFVVVVIFAIVVELLGENSDGLLLMRRSLRDKMKLKLSDAE